MKNRPIIIVVTIALIVFAASGLFAQGPYSPIGSPTVPPSSTAGPLPLNPVGSRYSGNLPITGNVPSGRHFRGVVPYSSYTEFNALLNSASLDSFIRRSAWTAYPGYRTSRTQSLYIPSKSTATVIRNVRSSSVPPHVTFKGDPGRLTLPAPPRFDTGNIYRERRPLSRDITELEKIINEQIGLKDFESSVQKEFELLPAQREGLFDDMISKARRRLDERLIDESLKPPEPAKPQTPLTLKQQREQMIEESQDEITERLDRMQSDLLDQIGFEEEEQQARQAEQTTDETEKPEELKHKYGLDIPLEVDKLKIGKLKIGKIETPELEIPKRPEIPDVSHERAVKIRGPYKTHEELAAARFGQYTKAAKDFMKEKKFYRAADTYSLAEIWDPESYMSYAGRSFALLGAGEYMSSSYFLEKAVTLSPGFARQKTALTDLLDDRDLIEDRIVEISKWLQSSKSPELAFLLAYIYYQTDRLEEAKAAINITEKLMGETAATINLKEAVDVVN